MTPETESELAVVFVLGGRTELVNHFAGYSTDAMEGFAKKGTNEQLDKLGAYLTR